MKHSDRLQNAVFLVCLALRMEYAEGDMVRSKMVNLNPVLKLVSCDQQVAMQDTACAEECVLNFVENQSGQKGFTFANGKCIINKDTVVYYEDIKTTSERRGVTTWWKTNANGMTSACPVGWKTYTDRGNALRCFKMIEEQLYFHQGACKCAAIGARPAMLDSTNLTAFIITQFGDGDFWFGLRKDPDQAGYKFYWMDGRPLTWEKWDSGQPNNRPGPQNCVALTDGKWADKDCGDKKYFTLCERL